jgi:hypothetical protein
MNKIKIFLILLFFSLFFPSFVMADDAFPDFPMSFYGTATLNGALMPIGSKIQVYSGSNLLSEVTLGESGVYGYDDPTKIKLVVGTFTGNLSFKYLLSGAISQTGCSSQEYTGGFLSGSSVIKNLVFSTNCGNTNTGGGGGGGGGNITYCSIVTYSSWQTCIGNQQFRTVLTSSPTACTLTTPQQLGVSRTCQTATSTDTILNQATSTQSLIAEQQVLGVKVANVVAEEELLTTKIDTRLIKRLAGQILLQTEQYGQAWYLDAVSLKRYYLADGDSAYGALREFGLGIKNADINKIPIASESVLPTGYVASESTYSNLLTTRLSGRIVIQVENHGEAWYINPEDGKRYYLANGEAAYQIMRQLSLGISNDNIRKITVGYLE